MMVVIVQPSLSLLTPVQALHMSDRYRWYLVFQGGYLVASSHKVDPQLQRKKWGEITPALV